MSEPITAFRWSPAWKQTLKNVSEELGVSQTTIIHALLYDLFGSDEGKISLEVVKARVSAIRREVEELEASTDLTEQIQEIPPGDERRARMEKDDSEPVELTELRKRELRRKYPALVKGMS